MDSIQQFGWSELTYCVGTTKWVPDPSGLRHGQPQSQGTKWDISLQHLLQHSRQTSLSNTSSTRSRTSDWLLNGVRTPKAHRTKSEVSSSVLRSHSGTVSGAAWAARTDTLKLRDAPHGIQTVTPKMPHFNIENYDKPYATIKFRAIQPIFRQTRNSNELSFRQYEHHLCLWPSCHRESKGLESSTCGWIRMGLIFPVQYLHIWWFSQAMLENGFVQLGV